MLYVRSHSDVPAGSAASGNSVPSTRVQQANPMLFALLTLDSSNSRSGTAKSSSSSREGHGQMESHASSSSSSAALSRRPSSDISDEEFEQFKAEIHGFITQKIAQFRRTLQNRGHSATGWNRDATPQTNCVTPNIDHTAHFPAASWHRDVERRSLDRTAMDGHTAVAGPGPPEDQTRAFNANSALMPKFIDAGESIPSSVRQSTGIQHSKQAPVGLDLTLRTRQDFTGPANGNCRLVYPPSGGDNTFVRSNDDSVHSKCYKDVTLYSLTALEELAASPLTVEAPAETEGVSKVMLQRYWKGNSHNLRLFASTEYPQIMQTVAATCAKNQAESPGVLQAEPGTTQDHLIRDHGSPWLQNNTLGHMDQVPAGRPSYRMEMEAAVKPVDSVRGTSKFPGELQAESAVSVHQRRASPSEDQSAKRNIIVFGHRSEPARPELRSSAGETQNTTSVSTNRSEEPRRPELRPVYEDISDAENETLDTKLKEINSLEDCKTPQYEDISDEDTPPPGPEPNEGPSRLAETNDGFEGSHPKKDCETQTHFFKQEPIDEWDDDYVVAPISILGVTFEPEDEDLDSTETDEPEGGEPSPASPKPETSAPEAASFPLLPVFDTQEGFLQATQCESVIAVEFGMSSAEDDSSDTDNSCNYSPQLERNYLTAPRRMFVNGLLPPSSEPEDCLPEDQDEGEESKDVQKDQTQNGKDKLCIIQKLGRLMKRKTSRSKQRQPKTKGSDTEDEEEPIKRAKRKKKKKVKRPFSSDSEGPEDDGLKYQTPANRRLFSSGPDEGNSLGVESKPVDGELEPRPPSAETRPLSAEPRPPSAEPRPLSAEPWPPSADPRPLSAEPRPPSAEPRPPSAEPRPPSAEPRPPSADPRPPSAEPRPQSAEPRPPSAESSLPQHLSEPHGTPLLQTGPLIKPSVGFKSRRPRTMRRTPFKGKRVPQGSSKVLKKCYKADPERRSWSGSGHSGEDLPAKDKSSTEIVNGPCGAAEASPQQQEGTSSEDSPGRQLESVDEEAESSPMIPRLLVVDSFRPDGSMRLLKEPPETSKVSSETNKAHLLMNKKEGFVLPPKPAKEPNHTTKSKANVPKPPTVSRPPSLPSQEGPSSYFDSLPSTSRQLPEARQSPAPSRHSSGDGPTSSKHSSGDRHTSSGLSSGDSPASSRRLSGDGPASSRHLSGDGSASSRHLFGDSPTSSRHLSGDGPASSRHLSGDGPASSRHLSGDGPASSRHLSGDGPASSRHWSGDGPTSSRHLSGDGHTVSRHLSGDGPTSSRRLSGDGPASSRHLSGDGPARSRHLSGDGPARSRHLSGDGPARSRHLSGDGPASSRHSSGDGPASSRRSSGEGSASSSVSSNLQRSQSYEGPALNRSPPKGPAYPAGTSSSALTRVRKGWKETFVPTRRDRKTSLGARRRNNSTDHATPLMKKTMNDAKQWTKATNRDPPKEKRPYTPEGYKWSQKPAKGSRRRSESPSLIDKSETDFPSHWDPNYL